MYLVATLNRGLTGDYNWQLPYPLDGVLASKTEALNLMSQDGWELVTKEGSEYIFVKKCKD